MSTKQKKIEDYLHLYLGCECIIEEIYGVFIGIHKKTSDPGYLYIIDLPNQRHYSEAAFVKLILWPLSDITEEECETVNVNYSHQRSELSLLGEEWSFEQVRFLLLKHFDLFGLIDAGLAIDKTKITEHDNREKR